MSAVPNEWARQSVSTRPVFNWCSARTLAALTEVNEICIELLCRLAIEPASMPRIAPVEQLREAFGRTDETARKRAAQCPVLLVDIDFRNAQWWECVRKHPHAWRVNEARPMLPRKPASQLARATLMLAWHAVRFERETASLLMGIAPQVADIIAAHTLREIDQLSQTCASCLRPRWSDRLLAWRTLLEAASTADPESIRDLRIYALQLAGSEALRDAA